MPRKYPDFWKKVRKTLSEDYGITAQSKLKDKYGYQLFFFIQSVAFNFNELGEPPKKVVKCPECDSKFSAGEKAKKGLDRHIEVKHKKSPQSP